MAPQAAHRRQPGVQMSPAACAGTPCKPAPGAAATALQTALPQQWRQPACMVLAAAALLLCAPYLVARTPTVPQLVPVAVSRRHLQQPGVELHALGEHACTFTSASDAVGDLDTCAMCHTM